MTEITIKRSANGFEKTISQTVQDCDTEAAVRRMVNSINSIGSDEIEWVDEKGEAL